MAARGPVALLLLALSLLVAVDAFDRADHNYVRPGIGRISGTEEACKEVTMKKGALKASYPPTHTAFILSFGCSGSGCDDRYVQYCEGSKAAKFEPDVKNKKEITATTKGVECPPRQAAVQVICGDVECKTIGLVCAPLKTGTEQAFSDGGKAI